MLDHYIFPITLINVLTLIIIRVVAKAHEMFIFRRVYRILIIFLKL